MMNVEKKLVLGISGATGAYAARLLVEKSSWPVLLVASRWGRAVFEHECGPFRSLASRVEQVFENDDLFATIASGSVPTAGMIILPCSANTLGQIASGVGDTLLTRAAHCHLKERRPLVLGLRETPLTFIDLKNATRVSAAGGIIMPMAPPYYMTTDKDPSQVSVMELLSAFVDRVLAILGQTADRTWENMR